MSKRVPHIIFNCDGCKKECSVAPSYYNKNQMHHFCSQQCNKIYRRKHLHFPSIGEKIHKLQFIKSMEGEEISKLPGLYYECLCDCGEITHISQNQWGKIKTCGRAAIHYTGENNWSYKGYNQISQDYWSQVKYNAGKRKFEFNITIEYAWKIFESQRGLCALSGIEISHTKDSFTKKRTASLDRIDSSKGYIETNIQWVHKDINILKNDLNVNDFREWCYKVANKSGHFPEKLDFNQVLILPKPTDIASRNDVDLFTNKIQNIHPSTIPIIAANLDTVGTFSMAKELLSYNVMTCLHKHYTDEEYISFFKTLSNEQKNKIYFSTGITESDFQKLKIVYQYSNIRNICLDVAHCETPYVYNHIDKIKNIIPNINLMVGNIATPDSIETFANLNVKILKCGIGSGALCTTRLMTGVGVPQLSANLECAQEAKRFGIHICSDGGCVYPADIVKALGCGASVVMIGSMLAGTDECEGQWVEENGKRFLISYGMSSSTAMKKHGSELKHYRASEGRTVKVQHKGPVSSIVQQILGGIRSACSYTNSHNLIEFPNNVDFIQVNSTHNNMFESITTEIY